jgi:hypothetical protein
VYENSFFIMPRMTTAQTSRRARKTESQRRKRIMLALTGYAAAKITAEEVSVAFLVLDREGKEVDVDTVYNYLRPEKGIKLYKREGLDPDTAARVSVNHMFPHRNFVFADAAPAKMIKKTMKPLCVVGDDEETGDEKEFLSPPMRFRTSYHSNQHSAKRRESPAVLEEPAVKRHKVETPAVAKDSNDPWNGMLIWSKEMESAVELMKNAFATENQALKTYCMQRMDLIREEMARCQTSLMGNNSNVVGS